MNQSFELNAAVTIVVSHSVGHRDGCPAWSFRGFVGFAGQIYTDMTEIYHQYTFPHLPNSALVVSQQTDYIIAVSTPSLSNSASQNSQITFCSLNAIVAQSKDC